MAVERELGRDVYGALSLSSKAATMAWSAAVLRLAAGPCADIGGERDRPEGLEPVFGPVQVGDPFDRPPRGVVPSSAGCW